jgi:hypothetical protein
MSEVREFLRPYQNKRITVRGTLSYFNGFMDRDIRREVGGACIKNPEIDGVRAADHVWVTHVQHWADRKEAGTGKQIEFTALVITYPDQKLGCHNFGLRDPDDFVVLNVPLALRIPEPEREAPAVVPQAPAAGNGVPAPAECPLGMLRRVKRFVKLCGGFEQAAKMFEALAAADLPLHELRQWVVALGEE